MPVGGRLRVRGAVEAQSVMREAKQGENSVFPKGEEHPTEKSDPEHEEDHVHEHLLPMISDFAMD